MATDSPEPVTGAWCPKCECFRHYLIVGQVCGRTPGGIGTTRDDCRDVTEALTFYRCSSCRRAHATEKQAVECACGGERQWRP